MRKLPRKSYSHSPSLAWVAFAVLFLSLAAGIGGLYAHRQNLEISKRKQIAELKREIAKIQNDTQALANEFEGRVAFHQLGKAVKDKGLTLKSIDPARREIVTPPGSGKDPSASKVIAVSHQP